MGHQSWGGDFKEQVQPPHTHFLAVETEARKTERQDRAQHLLSVHSIPGSVPSSFTFVIMASAPQPPSPEIVDTPKVRVLKDPACTQVGVQECLLNTQMKELISEVGRILPLRKLSVRKRGIDNSLKCS